MFSLNLWLKLIIVAFGCIIISCLTIFDMTITHWLWQKDPDSWVFFMDRSIFQGQQPGFNDCLVFIYITAFCCRLIPASLVSRYVKELVWEKVRLASGFLMVSGLWLGIFVVHIPKLVWARVRPESLVDHQLFTPWYVPGPPFSNLEISQISSFPSGHTAMTLSFFSLALIFWLIAPRRVGWLLTVLALLTTAIMGLSRSAMGKHWVTDWVFILIAGALFLQWCFFKGLDMPKRWRTLSEEQGFRGFGWEPWKRMLKGMMPLYLLMMVAKALSYL